MTTDPQTRARILRAARGVFAERGRRRATVREICARAKVNVAAVSYHFGSKDELYSATLGAALEEHFAEHPVVAPRGVVSAERLRAVIAGIAATMLRPRPEWHVRLLNQELAEPSEALDLMVRTFLRPRFAALCAALRPFLPGAARRAVELHALSVIGQLFYYCSAKPVALRLLGERSLTPALVERIVTHVTGFTLRAVGVGA